MQKHTCIRCKKEYKDKDQDDYLCEECNAQRLAIAQEIDAKVGSTVGQQPNSRVRSLEELAKSNGKFKEGMDGGIKVSSMAINYKDLL